MNSQPRDGFLKDRLEIAFRPLAARESYTRKNCQPNRPVAGVFKIGDGSIAEAQVAASRGEINQRQWSKGSVSAKHFCSPGKNGNGFDCLRIFCQS